MKKLAVLSIALLFAGANVNALGFESVTGPVKSLQETVVNNLPYGLGEYLLELAWGVEAGALAGLVAEKVGKNDGKLPVVGGLHGSSNVAAVGGTLALNKAVVEKNLRHEVADRGVTHQTTYWAGVLVGSYAAAYAKGLAKNSARAHD